MVGCLQDCGTHDILFSVAHQKQSYYEPKVAMQLSSYKLLKKKSKLQSLHSYVASLHGGIYSLRPKPSAFLACRMNIEGR